MLGCYVGVLGCYNSFVKTTNPAKERRKEEVQARGNVEQAGEQTGEERFDHPIMKLTRVPFPTIHVSRWSAALYWGSRGDLLLGGGGAH